MKIVSNNGDFEISSKEQIAALVRKSAENPFDEIWVCHQEEYPCLGILINGQYAMVDYFTDEGGEMWQSSGCLEENVEFQCGGDVSEMPGSEVIPLDQAIKCIEEFFDSPERPGCIEWNEL